MAGDITWNTLPGKMGKDVYVMEVCGNVSSIRPGVSRSRGERTLQQQGAVLADALSSVRLRDWGTSRRRVDGLLLEIEHGLGGHVAGASTGNGAVRWIASPPKRDSSPILYTWAIVSSNLISRVRIAEG